MLWNNTKEEARDRKSLRLNVNEKREVEVWSKTVIRVIPLMEY